jgi:hypothetical protein
MSARKKMVAMTAAVSGIAAAGESAHGALIGVQLYNSNGTKILSSTTAGLIPQANWNVQSTGTTVTSLQDSTGTTTGVSFGYTNSFDGYLSGTGHATSNETLLSSKVGSSSSTDTVTFTLGNVSAGTYNVVVYTLNNATGHEVITTLGTTKYYTIDQNGSAFTSSHDLFVKASNTNIAGPFDTGNYVEFTGVKLTGTGSIPFTVVGTTSSADISAVQLQLAGPSISLLSSGNTPSGFGSQLVSGSAPTAANQGVFVTPAGSAANTLAVSGKPGDYVPGFVKSINSSAAGGSPGDAANYVRVGGFTGTDTELFGLKLDENGSALAPGAAALSTIASDINLVNTGVTASVLPTNGGATPNLAGYDVLLKFSAPVTNANGYLGFNFAGYSDGAVGNITVTDIAVIPEPAGTALVAAMGLGLMTVRRRKMAR